MSSEFEQKLEKYAEVILKVGLNFQSGQRLLIGGPSISTDGTPIEAASLVRLITKKAYQMGARLVDVIWADEQLRLIRLLHAPEDSIEEYPKWKIDARYDISQAGDANMVIFSPNPDLLSGVEPDLISRFQTSMHKHLKQVTDLLMNNALNWLVVSAPTEGWADKIFPDIPQDKRQNKLWDIIFEMCRINQDDPISAWRNHIDGLTRRCNYLNQKQYKALKLTAPGTNLMVGLPKDHVWKGGSFTTQSGINFAANLPTEEVMTLPHKDKVEGVVSITKPVFYGGSLIEDCCLTFSKGRIVEATAKIGEEFLLNTIKTDEGSHRLGEIALVPHSSPISQTGLLYYNTLIDENASVHLALGQAYRASLKNGGEMTEEEFLAAGGNLSLIHLDVMIGSGEMNITGVMEDENTEPIMRNGEWTFEV